MTFTKLAWRLLLVTSATIFIVEGAIMWLLHLSFLGGLSQQTQGLLDALTLTLVSFPVLYLSFFRPMAKAEANLQQLNTTLEQRVRERTAALEQANARLQVEIEERRGIEASVRQEKEALTRVNAMMIDREERILGLKQEMNATLKEFGRPARYSV